MSGNINEVKKIKSIFLYESRRGYFKIQKILYHK